MSADSGNNARKWQRWAFAALPAVGLLELAAQLVQAHEAPGAQDWKSARDYVAAEARPEDLVAFAPRWSDPLGREYFGDTIATLEREARPDDTRFPRALEVSIRGQHLAELHDWRPGPERRFGGVTVTIWENPAPAKLLDDLVSRVEHGQVRVSQVQSGVETPCPGGRGGGRSGGLGFGPAVPSQRFGCSNGSFVGVSVVADLDYVPRRCVFAPPAGATLRLRFEGVRFGRSLHGHHALYVEAERGKQGAPVTLSFATPAAPIGQVIHRDGEGWKPFELDTSDLAGKTGDLTVDIASTGERRLYCFEADTR